MTSDPEPPRMIRRTPASTIAEADLPAPCGKPASYQWVVQYPDGTYGISDPLCRQHTHDYPATNTLIDALKVSGEHPCGYGSIF